MCTFLNAILKFIKLQENVYQVNVVFLVFGGFFLYFKLLFHFLSHQISSKFILTGTLLPNRTHKQQFGR